LWADGSERFGCTRTISSGYYHLYLAQSDGKSATVHITDSSNVSATKVVASGLRWIDDDNLIFQMCSGTSSYSDLYRYHAPTKSLTNLTGAQGTTKPFSLAKTARLLLKCR